MRIFRHAKIGALREAGRQIRRGGRSAHDVSRIGNSFPRGRHALESGWFQFPGRYRKQAPGCSHRWMLQSPAGKPARSRRHRAAIRSRNNREELPDPNWQTAAGPGSDRTFLEPTSSGCAAWRQSGPRAMVRHMHLWVESRDRSTTEMRSDSGRNAAASVTAWPPMECPTPIAPDNPSASATAAASWPKFRHA